MNVKLYMSPVYLAISNWGPVSPEQTSVWPELAVCLLIFGSCAFLQWRGNIKAKRICRQAELEG